MRPAFGVRVLSFEVLREIEGVWTRDAFESLLRALDIDDTAGLDEGDLRDLALMALQDMPPQRAAEIVLRERLGGRLTQGQIQDAANDMQEEKLWENFADLSLHEAMFNVGSLLHQAQPRAFPEPDAVSVRLEVTPGNRAASQLLERPLHESFMVRLLGDGMDERALLRRLFGEQLAGKPFPEAETIVWIVRSQPLREGTAVLDFIGSGYWLDALRTTRSYESSAVADA